MRNTLATVGFVACLLFLGQRFGFLTSNELKQQFHFANMAIDFVQGKNSDSSQAAPNGSVSPVGQVEPDKNGACLATNSCDLPR